MTDDARQNARYMRDMMSTPGYTLQEAYINTRIARITSDLAKADFTNLLAVGKLQGELKAFNDLRNNNTGLVNRGMKEDQ